MYAMYVASVDGGTKDDLVEVTLDACDSNFDTLLAVRSIENISDVILSRDDGGEWTCIFSWFGSNVVVSTFMH